jgi:preprotein translocase SecE subunit
LIPVLLAEASGKEGWSEMSDEKKEPVAFKRLHAFLHETVLEMKRSTWPDRRTLVMHTVIVIAGVLCAGLYVGISDKVLAVCLRLAWCRKAKRGA